MRKFLLSILRTIAGLMQRKREGTATTAAPRNHGRLRMVRGAGRRRRRNVSRGRGHARVFKSKRPRRRAAHTKHQI
jgi:hypothetical protein